MKYKVWNEILFPNLKKIFEKKWLRGISMQTLPLHVLTLSGAVGRIMRPTCFFAVFQAFLIHFTLFSAQVFDFRLWKVIIMKNCIKLLINNSL